MQLYEFAGLIQGISFDGNISQKTLNAQDTDYEYDTTTGGGVCDGDIMTTAGSNSFDWDENGRLVTGLGEMAKSPESGIRLDALFENA